jgi:hypothetical protein
MRARLETILVVQSAEDWRRDDAMTTTNLMAAPPVPIIRETTSRGRVV